MYKNHQVSWKSQLRVTVIVVAMVMMMMMMMMMEREDVWKMVIMLITTMAVT